MLTKLLSRETCADCQLCCVFDRYDIWETPVLSAEIRESAAALLPDAEFIRKGEESYLFRIRELDHEDLFGCPLLDPTSGCMLGEEKPFDCQIWPFRIMELGGRQAITIAPICEAMTAQPIGTLLAFLRDGLADTIFDYAAQHPDVIKPYDSMYPILLWKNEGDQEN